MLPIDLYDVSEAFESLDTDCDGRISLEALLQIFLGLGYQPTTVQKADLQRAAGGATDNLSLQNVIEVLSKYERFPTKSSRTDHMKSMFDLLIASRDDGNKRRQCWTASDLVQLSLDMGEPVSERQAAAMVAHISTSSDDNAVVTLDDFINFWSPPEPPIEDGDVGN